MVRLITSILLTIIASSSFAQNGRLEIGRVVYSQGEASIITPDGERVAARRRASIARNDALETGSNGAMQVRLLDDSFMAISCESRLSFNKPTTGINGVFQLELVSGRIRAVARNTESEFYPLKVVEPEVLVQVHEMADYEVVKDIHGNIYFGVYQGAITIRTGSGELRLGVMGNFDYATIRNRGAPTGEANAPTIILESSDCTAGFTTSHDQI